MTTRYIVEFRCKANSNDPNILPSLNAFDAETLPLAQREVEKTLASGIADEAVLYAPMRVLQAARVVTISDMTGRKADAPSVYPATDGVTA